MNDIRVLDKAVSELIAAGEVVTRPASAVKELIENSIDAGADAVTVELTGNGLKSIKIVDNGCGIPKDQLKTAFKRHATSKLREADDLLKLGSLGFRGEALPSIAAVAKVRVVTCTQGSEFGAEYVIEGGEERYLRECGCPVGTAIYVDDLFYNTPARMKFLKKDVSEGNAVQQVAEQLALAYPHVSLKLVREGKQVLFTPGTGLQQAMFSVFPRALFVDMLPIDEDKDGYIVNGYASAPQVARASRGFQYTYVNGRYVKNKTITAAAEEAYSSFSHRGTYPAFVIFVSTDPERVDANVHPAKTEVRFENERAVFSAVYSAVRSAVMQFARATPTQSPVNEEQAPAPAEQQPFISFTGSNTDINENNYDILKKLDLEQPGTESYFEATKQISLKEDNTESDDTVSPKIDEQTNEEPAPEPEVKFVGETFSTYIIVETDDSLIFMDKHAAHERALFEKFSENVSASRQSLLEPIVLELDLDSKQAILENKDTVLGAGFLVEDFGGKEVIVREMPMYFSRKAAQSAVSEIASSLSASSGAAADELQRLRLIQSVSCRAAIKAGDKSSANELTALAKQIISGSVPRFCPHGRPLYFQMSKRELDKKFDRT